VIPDGPGGGQNAALLAGFSHARRYDAGARVAALSGDLPSLRAEDLTHAFTCGAGVPRWFVADADGLGTTMLAVESGRDLSPCFGPRSRHEHRLSGAVDLAAPGLERLRRDVDTVDHLWQAVELGVGSHTHQTLRELGLDPDSQRRATDIA
jgi:2-phospho-L-lactate guanylyltransferase